MQISKIPLLITAVLAALQFIAGASTLADLLPAVAVAWFVLIVGAVQVAVAVYQRGAVPAAAVAAAYDVDGSLVAGPAAWQSNGTPVAVLAVSDAGIDDNGDPVFLTPAADVAQFSTGGVVDASAR